jgi:hypothetical protein
MNCNEIKELLSLYIDRMLDESQAAEVEEHLSSCDSCRKEYHEIKEIIDLLGQSDMIPVPDAFNMRLKRALKEEKQNMIASGMIGKPAKKKYQWRMITSVAAVFVVGLLTLSLYSDVLGILPDRLNGSDQTGAAEPEAAYKFDSGETGDMDDAVGNPNLSSDGSVKMKEESGAPQQMAMADTAAEEKAEAETPTYGFAAAGSEPSVVVESNSGEDYLADSGVGSSPDSEEEFGMLADSGEQESAAAADGSSGNLARNSKLAPSPDECSRSLTSSGVERNAAAVQFYNNLIEERLEGFDYQILDSGYVQTGEWRFKVFIFRGQDGNTYNEEILILGKDGEIEVICSDQFMGL